MGQKGADIHRNILLLWPSLFIFILEFGHLYVFEDTQLQLFIYFMLFVFIRIFKKWSSNFGIDHHFLLRTFNSAERLRFLNGAFLDRSDLLCEIEPHISLGFFLLDLIWVIIIIISDIFFRLILWELSLRVVWIVTQHTHVSVNRDQLIMIVGVSTSG